MQTPVYKLPGRDHWGAVQTVFFAGGGVRGGTVVGASDKNGGFPRDDPQTPENMAATIYHAQGIPPTLMWRDALDRPHHIYHGRPMPFDRPAALTYPWTASLARKPQSDTGMSKPANSFDRGSGPPRAVLNRRVWVRYLCPLDTPGQTFDTQSYQSAPARVLNLSVCGIGLFLDTPLGEGTQLKVELEGWGGSRMLLARVVHVTEQADGWVHGCELVNPISGGEIEDLLS